MQKFKLNRTVQCAKCPWKVETDPNEIPHGYSREKHENLSCTIADENQDIFAKSITVMACHHSPVGNEQYCIGWLHHQLGPGNNIALRMQMRHCENIGDIKVIGEQHQTFEETLK